MISINASNKILVVDDDPTVLEMVSSLLIYWGHNVIACNSAQKATEECRKGGICLIVSDVRMPGTSGTELLGMIHELDPDIPVILMTAYAEIETAIDAVRKGAFDFIIKPFKPELLQHAVEKGVRFRNLVETEKRYLVMMEEKIRESEENLQAAAMIQQNFLPTSPPEGTPFNFAWQFHPCERVGGDLFNLFWLDENRLGIYLLDVGGHGVPAAMVTTSVAQTLEHCRGWFCKRAGHERSLHLPFTPADVLAKLNEKYPVERFGQLLTICYLILDMQSGNILYSNAALPLPFIIRSDGRVESLKKGGIIIGADEEATYENGNVIMESGDRLFIYTDGITEYDNMNGEAYGEERLVMELKKSRGEPLQTACSGAIQRLLEFGDNRLSEDDITLLGVEFSP